MEATLPACVTTLPADMTGTMLEEADAVEWVCAMTGMVAVTRLAGIVKVRLEVPSCWTPEVATAKGAGVKVTAVGSPATVDKG